VCHWLPLPTLFLKDQATKPKTPKEQAQFSAKFLMSTEAKKAYQVLRKEIARECLWEKDRILKFIEDRELMDKVKKRVWKREWIQMYSAVAVSAT
jgi:hypothetical protein